MAFFAHDSVNKLLAFPLAKLREGEQLSEAEILAVMNICLEAARLPLVNNNESLLCAQFHVQDGHINSATAVYNNLYAKAAVERNSRR